MATFEGYERRIDKINACLKEYGFTDLDQVKAYTVEKGMDVEIIKIEGSVELAHRI